jgi:hypothetical protein
MNVEDIVSAYLSLRKAREDLERKYEAEDTELKAQMTQLEMSLLTVCNEVNANSINTKNGTVIRKLNERFFCNDWDNFRKFEHENKDYDFRERRIHQGNFKQYMAEHQNDGLPPGVNVMREFAITVRKPTSDS